MCTMDCFNCTKPDCDVDGVTFYEKCEQDKRDKSIELDRASEDVKRRREYQRKYDRSEKGKARSNRYIASYKGKEKEKRRENTEKGIERHKRYEQSERGKAARTQYREQLIASGKNAEYCRAYYQRQKEKKQKELISEPA